MPSVRLRLATLRARCNSPNSTTRKEGKFSMKTLTAAVLVSLLIGTGGCATKIVFPGSPTVPAAQAKAKINRDDNGNAKIELKVRHLARPSSLYPPRSVYIVWLQTPENKSINFGQLTVDDDLEGTITGISPYARFRIVITAEDGPEVLSPGPQIVLSTDVFDAK